MQPLLLHVTTVRLCDGTLVQYLLTDGCTIVGVSFALRALCFSSYSVRSPSNARDG